MRISFIIYEEKWSESFAAVLYHNGTEFTVWRDTGAVCGVLDSAVSKCSASLDRLANTSV